MDIVITQWALDAFLDLRSLSVFTEEEYWGKLREDALLLKSYPKHTKFNNGKFWSIASDGRGQPLRGGYKMKWHQIGPGKVQLRLLIGLHHQSAFLCEAYVKSNEQTEKRKLAKFKTHLQLIRENRYIICGVLK